MSRLHAMHLLHAKHQADKERERMHARKKEFAEHIAARDAAKRTAELRKAAASVGTQRRKTIALFIASLSGRKQRPAQ